MCTDFHMGMDPDLYKAAVGGDLSLLKEKRDQWLTQTTPNGNTILHVIAQFHSDDDYSSSEVVVMQDVVREITDLAFLTQTNSKKETALHFAARYGRLRAASGLISRVKELSTPEALEDLESGRERISTRRSDPHEAAPEKVMTRKMNADGDTALHEAVRGGHIWVAELLLEEDPDLVNLPNRAGESPLYLAVASGKEEIAMKILASIPPSTSSALAYSGPKGRNPLHAAAMSNNFVGLDQPHSENYAFPKEEDSPVLASEIVIEWLIITLMELASGKRSALEKKEKTLSPELLIKQLLKKNPNLNKQGDELGWTPLHYASRFNDVTIARLLLSEDKSIAYIAAENDCSNTPLHVAVYANNVQVMEEILARCPDCWEMVTSQGCNVLHIAIIYEQQKVFDKILEKYEWADKLVSQKDGNGNTPLHLYAASENFNGGKLVNHPQTNKNAYNKELMTPLDVLDCSKLYCQRKNQIRKELLHEGCVKGRLDAVKRDGEWRSKYHEFRLEEGKEIPIDYKKIGDSQIIVAVLIATVAFAGAFTVPGGFHGDQGPNQGTAVLSRKAAFKVFVVADSLAMLCSISAVFSQLYSFFDKDQLEMKDKGQRSFQLVMLAMYAMVVAFSTGLYAVLPPASALAIFVCVIAGLWYLVFFGLSIKARLDVYSGGPKEGGLPFGLKMMEEIHDDTSYEKMKRAFKNYS